jgi:hypothetical protein
MKCIGTVAAGSSRKSRDALMFDQSMLTILITDAFPILCSATMHSPGWQ